MGWIKLVRHVPEYSRQLRRPSSYDVWVQGEGAAVIAQLAAARRFSLLGRTRAARRSLWTALRRRAEHGRLANAIERGVQRCVLAAGEIAGHPLGFPRAVIDGYRLVIVPRVTWNARAFAVILRELEAHPDLEAVGGGPLFRLFFLTELFEQVDRALTTSAPSLRHALPTADGWFVIGFEPSTSWAVPLNGPERRGHFFVCEAPPGGLKKWPARRVQAALSQMQADASTLSRAERDRLLREARTTASLVSSPAMPPPRPEAPARRVGLPQVPGSGLVRPLNPHLNGLDGSAGVPRSLVRVHRAGQ